MKSFFTALGALFLCGCVSSQTAVSLARIQSDIDRLMGREPLSVRLAYVEAHPELTNGERDAILRGERTISLVEAQTRPQGQGLARGSEAWSQPQRDDPAAVLFQARTDYFNAHPALSADVRRAIQDGKVIPGMTKEEVYLSWQAPVQIVPVNSESGKVEFWDYGDNNFLTFESDALKSWGRAHGH